MLLNRRALLGGGLVGLTLSAAAPVLAVVKKSSPHEGNTDYLIERLKLNKTIFNELIHLDKPVVVDFPSKSIITNCVFIAEFNKPAPMFFLSPESSVTMMGCVFTGNQKTMATFELTNESFTDFLERSEIA